MTGIRVVLIACLLSLCGQAWASDAPAIRAGGRVGIIEMVTNDVTHFHVGRTEVNSFMRTYRAEWAAADLIDVPLMTSLTNAGFVPVPIAPSDTLRKERQSWFVDKPQAKKLARGCMKELARLMADQNLAAVIVIAPGANNDPEFMWSRMPESIQGFGILTSEEPNGVTKGAVFDLTQIVLVANTSDGAELVVRDWGAVRSYDWPEFDATMNLKALTRAQLASVQPVISEAIKQRIATRIVPRLKS